METTRADEMETTRADEMETTTAVTDGMFSPSTLSFPVANISSHVGTLSGDGHKPG
jgi:hypothetical protein